MTDTKWVVSKYAPETGERFEVKEEFTNFYLVARNGYLYVFLKSEYIPCPPPERWERVPITEVLELVGRRRMISLRYDEFWCAENERLSIIAGALVLERRGSK